MYGDLTELAADMKIMWYYFTLFQMPTMIFSQISSGVTNLHESTGRTKVWNSFASFSSEQGPSDISCGWFRGAVLSLRVFLTL